MMALLTCFLHFHAYGISNASLTESNNGQFLVQHSYMTKIHNYEDAVNVLRSYDVLPEPLILPAYLVAFDEEYGRRPVVRGMVKHAVNIYENVLSIETTPNYEPVAIAPRVSFWQDVETIAGHLEQHPNNGKTAYYWEFTRQWYYDPKQIEAVLQMQGMVWVSLRKVKEAVRLVRASA